MERGVFEPERSLAVFDGSDPVATGGAYTRNLSVPGGELPAAHVTLVSVRPTHRRRGLLTRMMSRQLQDVHDAGVEPIAVLWSSEEAIYGRYGYGPAAAGVVIEADTREVSFPGADPPGQLRMVTPTDAVKELSEVYEQVRRRRPGMSSRSDRWWTLRLCDIGQLRKDATARRCVLYEDAGEVTGYALWRSKQEWDNTGPNSTVQVEELRCADKAGYQELWRFLFHVDLTRRITAWNLAVDEPLFHLVDAPRRLGRRHNTSLFTRIVDLPAALRSRRYAAPLDLVLQVTDDLLPANTGRWRLTAGPHGAGPPDPQGGAAAASADVGLAATCERTDAPADLALNIRELGAAYLGGTSLGALAGAGRVTEVRPGALAAASAGFGWHVAPCASEMF